ncbi:MAG: transglutaminaseTgpA domain-containing protein [Acidimicrobiales bacterium]
MTTASKQSGVLLVSGILLVVSSLGLRPVFEGWLFLVPVVAGAAVGLGVAAFGRWKRLYLGETLALSLLAFGAVGTLFIVGPHDPLGFAGALVDGWSDLLSASPPAALTPTLRVVPYATAWFGAAISGELVRRGAPAISVAVGPVAVLLATCLLTVGDKRIAVAQGVVLSCGVLLLGHLSAPRLATGLRELTGPLAVGVVLVSVAIVTAVVGPYLPTPTERDRFDLRTYQDRPWDPLDEPSPLVTIKAALKAGVRDDERFIVTASTPIERFGVATLSSYAGTVWAVTDAGSSGASRFVPIDRRFPDSPTAFGSEVTYAIDVVGGNDPWVPLSGWPRRIEVEGTESKLRFNAETGTAAVPGGLRPGTRLSITAVENNVASLDELAALTMVASPADGSELDLVPPAFVNVAGDVFEGVDRGSDHVVALAKAFSTAGFYDATGVARPGHSLARLSEFFADTDALIGYEEQFAAGAAVLLRIDGVAARVVVGYVVPPERYVDGSATVLAGDASAWIEVLTEERGWVPVDAATRPRREPEST